MTHTDRSQTLGVDLPPVVADLVVVGAGPHGLAVLGALAARAEPWPGRVVVVDPHEGWAEAWDAKLSRLALDRLRSPQVHHPGPLPMELRDLVEALPEQDRTALRLPDDERVPTPSGMRALIDAVAARLGPVEWHRAQVARVDVQGPEAATVTLADGSALATHAVVLAHNPSWARVPEWAEPWLSSGLARHAESVDLRTEQLDGRHIAIVGGGLTAGTLACEAIHRGAHVTLLSRRQLRERPYDVDAAWLGPRRLMAFHAAELEERRSMIDVARDGGTMPARVLDELRELAARSGSGLVIREAVDVETELRELLAEVPDEACAVDDTRPVDAIWLATGFENDVHRDPLAGPLVDALGVPTLHGLPAVSHDLRLPGSPVFVIGPYAALGVGPAARNLAGARPAAARIASALAPRPPA